VENIAGFSTPLDVALSRFVGSVKMAKTPWRFAEAFRHVRTRVLNSTKTFTKTSVRKLPNDGNKRFGDLEGTFPCWGLGHDVFASWGLGREFRGLNNYVGIQQ
jgi:hypothetical protein